MLKIHPFASILIANRKPLLFPSNIKAIITFVEEKSHTHTHEKVLDFSHPFFKSIARYGLLFLEISFLYET